MMAACSSVIPDCLDGMAGVTAPDGSLMTRLIDAPRAEVFRAWTDPVRLARWLEPHGFTDPVCEMELHPGGMYRMVLQTPDGTRYAVLFEEEGGKTRVTLETPLASIELCCALLGMDARLE
jgi:hypothetical protein